MIKDSIVVDELKNKFQLIDEVVEIVHLRFDSNREKKSFSFSFSSMTNSILIKEFHFNQ